MPGAWVEIVIIGTHTLRVSAPIDSSIDTHQDQGVRGSRLSGSCAHDENRTEVRCPRVTLAAMIAAASFGLRRSGTLANGNIGSGLLGRISEAWPALAPPDECSSTLLKITERAP